MTQRITEMSPRFLARMAAVLGVLEGVASVNGQLRIPNQLVVTTDAAATAANILGNESLFRWGSPSASSRSRSISPGTVLLYVLFRPVGRIAALLIAFFGSGDCSSGWRQCRSTPGLGPLEEREGFWRIQHRTTTVDGAPFPPMERAGL